MNKNSGISMIFHSFHKRWKFFSIITASFLLLGSFYSFFLQREKWTSSGSVIVSSTDVSNSITGTTTIISFLKEDTVLLKVQSQLSEKYESGISLESLSASISISSKRNSNSLDSSFFVIISSTSSRSDFAQDMVNFTIDDGVSLYQNQNSSTKLIKSSGASEPINSTSYLTPIAISTALGMAFSILLIGIFETRDPFIDDQKEARFFTEDVPSFYVNC